MKILLDNQLDECALILRNGGLLAFPTETVYGLGVIFDNKESYDRLVAVKRRPPEKPFTVMLADPEDVEKFIVLNPISKALVNAFMPGQFTLIGKAQKGLPKWCVTDVGYVGVRIADYDLIRNLIRKTGKPLLVPSANKSGETPANSSDEVNAAFGDELDGVIEGKTVSKTPSTIVLVDDNGAHLIRAGIITEEQIKNVIEKETK